MRPEAAARTHDRTLLSDYLPPDYLIDHVHLVFRLDACATRVKATLSMRRNPARAQEGAADLRLDGEAMTLISAAIDGAAVEPVVDETGLTLPAAAIPGASFVWTCETEINPEANKALEGLYLSKGMYCTQCEAEGFRKITYYLDRPDVMARFEVRIEAEREATPVLLSNGDPVGEGALADGWHYAEWHDPHPKPAYLFALVAGDLVSLDDRFVTASGRDVALKLFVRPGDEGKCDYAMDALKRSMAWDEEAYGREYDLDLFMIVAVDDFNMGAMENKGLNVFNSRLVLASPETATDANYFAIESVIAHEYFHNWTGNRITCRDWFQLCLKEGLTVYRDQQFSGDVRSHATCRIGDVIALRARQFREDAGPLAHPVRPEEYIEINNFYTATVYEKGAEVVGMLRTLVGPETYRKALDLYFERHDGQACTIEDFAKVFEDASGRDLTQFRRWWSQAGTPRLGVEESYENGTYTLTLRQHTPPTPGQDDKAPLLIPVAIGLLDDKGASVIEPGTQVLELTENEQRFTFEGLTGKPHLSVLRGFSAPVIVEREVDAAERAFLLAHDPDPFNRWEAGRGYAIDVLLTLATGGGGDVAGYAAAIGAALDDDAADPAFKALLLSLPGSAEIAARMAERAGAAEPEAIHAAFRALTRGVAVALEARLAALYDACAPDGPFSPDAQSAGRRALRNAALAYLKELDGAEAEARAGLQYQTADNMTDAFAALTALAMRGGKAAQTALDAFHERWKGDALVLDKWFGLQASLPHEGTLSRVEALTDCPEFDWRNPNRFRSLIGAFAGNHRCFHVADGSGYRFVAGWLARLDALNPQTSARMATCFESWRLYDEGRQAAMRAAMQGLLDREGASKDISEILGRIMG